MDTKQIVKTQGAKELTVSVLSRFEQSRIAYKQGNKESSLQTLKEIGSDVITLEEVSDRLKNYVQMDSDDHQRLSERLLIIIGNIGKVQTDLAALIATSKTEVEINKARIQADEEAILERRSEIASLQSEIDSIQKRFEEAAKWGWVPGYGQYLAGRTIADVIEGKAEQMKRAAKDLQKATRESQDTEQDRENIKASLLLLEKELSKDQIEQKELEAQKNVLEQQDKAYAERIAFSMDMTLYYRQLGESLNGVVDNLDNVMRVLRRLDEKITCYSSEGEEKEITLKEALLQLGKDADSYRPVRGEDVHHVDYGFSDKHIGSFLQTGQKKWSERSEEQNKVIYNFSETNRDEWSVYLYDDSRKVSLQLDVWVNKIYYSAPNTPRREQHQVLSALDRVTGWIAVVIEYGKPGAKAGSFVEVGPKKWSERSEKQNKIIFNFAETNRDEWSVYLYDDSRKASLQLDLWTSKVYYSDSSTPRSELYTITAVS